MEDRLSKALLENIKNILDSIEFPKVQGMNSDEFYAFNIKEAFMKTYHEFVLPEDEWED